MTEDQDNDLFLWRNLGNANMSAVKLSTYRRMMGRRNFPKKPKGENNEPRQF